MFKTPEMMDRPTETDKKGEEWVSGMRRYAGRSNIDVHVVLPFSREKADGIKYQPQRRLNAHEKLQNARNGSNKLFWPTYLSYYSIVFFGLSILFSQVFRFEV